MDDSTNPYQSPLAANHVRRTPSWHRWRTATSVLLMVIGTMFLLLLNGQEFTNSIVFLVCWITSLGIWLTNAAQKPRKIEVVLLIGLHVVMIRRFAVTWAELAASEWRWVTQKTRDDQHGWAMVKNMVNLPLRILAIIWASPSTLLGLLIGMAGICTGGHARIRGRVIEFYGGGVKWLEGKNVIWCATFQMAWDRLKGDVIGGAVRVANAEDVAARLNRASFTDEDLPAGSYHAAAGFAKDGIAEQVQREMRERFGKEPTDMEFKEAHWASTVFGDALWSGTCRTSSVSLLQPPPPHAINVQVRATGGAWWTGR